MKVLCVSREGVRNMAIPKIEVGDELTVSSEVISEDGKHCYIFEEIGPIVFNGAKVQPGYMSKNFAILPEQSADEMAEQEFESIIYQR
jgi:hypothetical protein